MHLLQIAIGVKMKKILILCAVLALSGCASSGVIPVGENKYMISDSNAMYWEGGHVMVDIIKEGTAYCAKQGKKFELLDQKTEDAQAGSLWAAKRTASAQIYFTCK